MKNLNTRSVRNVLVAFGTLLMPLLTANAQTGYPQSGDGFYAPDKQFTSSAAYDNQNVRTDSSTYLWTKNGYPVSKEYYNWDNGQIVYSMKGEIVSDTGNEFTYDLTSTSEVDNGTTRMEMSFDNNGDPIKAVTTTTVTGLVYSSEMDYQYWRSNNRIDSIMVTMSNSLTNDKSWAKTIFKTYDSAGRPTRMEHFQDTGDYSIETDAYFTDSSGKLQRIENQEDSYDSYGGNLYWVTKDITYFDSKERMQIDYYYDGNESLTDYSSYSVYHYDQLTGLKSPVLSVPSAIISLSNDWLSVKSSKMETITIYSLSGTVVYTGAKTSGEIQIPVGNLPQSIYIVRGSSGWVKKISK